MSMQDSDPRYFHEGRVTDIVYSFLVEKVDAETGQPIIDPVTGLQEKDPIDLSGVTARYILATQIGATPLLDVNSTDHAGVIDVDGPNGTVTVKVDLTDLPEPLSFPGRDPKQAGAHLRASVELVLTPSGGKPETKVKGPALIFAAVAI